MSSMIKRQRKDKERKRKDKERKRKRKRKGKSEKKRSKILYIGKEDGPWNDGPAIKESKSKGPT